jgi:6-pyruvoyltetrahydropterin/6-carboxytetrahydropterin synthase
MKVFKENIKFSAAHFLIFDSKTAERLHGHNYRVRFEIYFDSMVNDSGFVVEFGDLKKALINIVSSWDERVLLPKLNSEFKYQKKGKSLHVYFRDRFYVFPQSEVLLLPLTNTSCELLSALLAERVAEKMKGFSSLVVEIEESLGQSAGCEIKSN